MPSKAAKPGELYSETLWTAEKMRAGDWTPVQWFNPKLSKVATDINNYTKLYTTGDIHHWKIKNATFYTTFDFYAEDNGNCFCSINEIDMQTISATPGFVATPKEGKEKRANQAHKEADHILSATRFRTTSSRITTIYSEKPAIMGGAFSPIGVGNKETAKAYTAFLNSSFGIIQLLNRRNKTLTYIAFEGGQMKTLMLPDPNKADFAPLLAAFEQVKDTPLERLANCATDPARKILDHAAAQSIGIDPAITDQWREWLSGEPTITNKPGLMAAG